MVLVFCPPPNPLRGRGNGFLINSILISFFYLIGLYTFLKSALPNHPLRGGSNTLFLEAYSSLNASTGFVVAALKLCQLTVSNAIARAVSPAKANIHQLILVL